MLELAGRGLQIEGAINCDACDTVLEQFLKQPGAENIPVKLHRIDD